MTTHTRRGLGRLGATVAAVGASVLIAVGLATPASASGEARPSGLASRVPWSPARTS